MKQVLFALTLICGSTLLSLSGCIKKVTSEPNIDTASKVQESNINPETGNLIALWVMLPEKEEAIIITKPYAVFMQWYGDVKQFRFYDNIKKTITKTNDFDAFLARLAAMPKGTEIQKYDTCTVSQLHDMPQSEHEKLKSILHERNLKWAISEVNGREEKIFCTCRSKGLRYP